MKRGGQPPPIKTLKTAHGTVLKRKKIEAFFFKTLKKLRNATNYDSGYSALMNKYYRLRNDNNKYYIITAGNELGIYELKLEIHNFLGLEKDKYEYFDWDNKVIEKDKIEKVKPCFDKFDSYLSLKGESLSFNSVHINGETWSHITNLKEFYKIGKLFKVSSYTFMFTGEMLNCTKACGIGTALTVVFWG